MSDDEVQSKSLIPDDSRNSDPKQNGAQMTPEVDGDRWDEWVEKTGVLKRPQPDPDPDSMTNIDPDALPRRTDTDGQPKDDEPTDSEDVVEEPKSILRQKNSTANVDSIALPQRTDTINHSNDNDLFSAGYSVCDEGLNSVRKKKTADGAYHVSESYPLLGKFRVGDITEQTSFGRSHSLGYDEVDFVSPESDGSPDKSPSPPRFSATPMFVGDKPPGSDIKAEDALKVSAFPVLPGEGPDHVLNAAAPNVIFSKGLQNSISVLGRASFYTASAIVDRTNVDEVDSSQRLWHQRDVTTQYVSKAR